MSDFFLLVLCSLLTSTMTAVLGLGGGLFLIALMANLLPPIAVIPIHGIVQVFSNASRGLFAWHELVWRVVPAFLIGVIAGSAIAYPLLNSFPPEYLPLPLSLFILLMTWLPRGKYSLRLPGAIFILGSMQGFLSLFVGATGVMIPPFLMKEGLKGGAIVATHSLFMTIVHVAKIVIFGFIGFAFVQYVPLIAGMVVAAIIGSWYGTKLRRRITDERLKKILKIVITALAIRMLWTTLSGF